MAQNDARKRIDKLGEFRDVVADVKRSHESIGQNDENLDDETLPESDVSNTKLLELVLLADSAAIDAQERCLDVLTAFISDILGNLYLIHT